MPLHYSWTRSSPLQSVKLIFSAWKPMVDMEQKRQEYTFKEIRLIRIWGIFSDCSLFTSKCC